MTDESDTTEAQQFWDDFYRQHEHAGSGKANPVLVGIVGSLPAGTALDLGSGEGSDAIWLARAGWRVTAVDVSATVLHRAADRAATAGVGSQIDWQQHDLARTFPSGAFDLVSAQFLHSPVDFPREHVMQCAAGAVAPGGLLLIVGHAAFPPWAENPCPHPEANFPTPEEVLASLDLPPGKWHTERLESTARQAIGPNGQTATLTDTVVAVRHLSA